jgi:hypothetical protein
VFAQIGMIDIKGCLPGAKYLRDVLSLALQSYRVSVPVPQDEDASDLMFVAKALDMLNFAARQRGLHVRFLFFFVQFFLCVCRLPWTQAE